MDITQFYQTFFDEAEELLAEMEHLLLALDVSAPDNEQLNAIFRAAHSIKGGAATFGFTALTETTHLLENLLDRARRGELQLRTEMVVGLTSVGADIVAGQAPFVLFRLPDAAHIRTSLQRREIAVRRCDTFVGLDERYLRAAVRREWPLLVQAIHEISQVSMCASKGGHR